jgi:hypothetical protein
MVRGKVSDGVGYLSDAIVACGVLPLLARFCKQNWKDRPDAAALLACYACFATDQASFGPYERMILREFDIASITEVNWWARLVVAIAEPEPNQAILTEMVELHAKLRVIADTLPNILPSEPQDQVEPGASLIRIMLPTGEAAPTHPLRMSCAIEATCTLWNVVCDMVGAQVPLNFTDCIPEPEISMTFRGPTAQIVELKMLLMEVWERVVTSHNASPEERIETIPHSLSAMERIGTATEEAAALQRTLEAGVRMFLEVGACIPEMHDPERFTPARLLRVSTKLQEKVGISWAGRTRAIDVEADQIEAIMAAEHANLRRASPTPPFWIGNVRVG